MLGSRSLCLSSCPDSRVRVRSLSLSLLHMHTHSHIQRYLSLPNTCVSFNQKMIPCGLQGMCMHAHTQGYIFPIDPTTHTTHHAPSNIHYIDTLLTKTCKPQAHAHTRLYLIHKHILFYPLYTYQGGTSSHASVSSLTCLPTCSTPKDTQHSFSCPSNKLPSVP